MQDSGINFAQYPPEIGRTHLEVKRRLVIGQDVDVGVGPAIQIGYPFFRKPPGIINPHNSRYMGRGSNPRFFSRFEWSSTLPESVGKPFFSYRWYCLVWEMTPALLNSSKVRFRGSKMVSRNWHSLCQKYSPSPVLRANWLIISKSDRHSPTWAIFVEPAPPGSMALPRCC